MKHIKRIALLLGVLLLALPLSACKSDSGDTRTVAVITKAVNSDFWHAVRNGVETAAIEYNVSVTFEGPENEEDYEAQNRMIADAVTRRVDVIVLSAIDYDKTAAAVNDAVRHGVKVIAIDSSVNSELVSQFIGTDNYEAGKAAARAAVDFTPKNGARIRIGLVNYMSDTANGKRREDFAITLPQSETQRSLQRSPPKAMRRAPRRQPGSCWTNTPRSMCWSASTSG